MKEKIQQKITELESGHNIKVLFACESGSRAWGFPSPDSDYDVRFIYLNTMDWYMSLNQQRDTREYPINDLLDLSGWDIKKALQLMGKSNAVIFEWLQSPIIYKEVDQFSHSLLDIGKAHFSPISATYHYLSIAEKTINESLLENNIKVKKYFYAIRPLLAAKWVIEYGTVPPMELGALLAIVEERDIKNQIEALVERKASLVEGELIQRVDILNKYLLRELNDSKSKAGSLKGAKNKDFNSLNEFFRTYVYEHRNFT